METLLGELSSDVNCFIRTNCAFTFFFFFFNLPTYSSALLQIQHTSHPEGCACVATNDHCQAKYISHIYVAAQTNRKKKNTAPDFARENRCSCHLHCIHHQVCLQMCLQYTAHSESLTPTAVDSFTYTDTHPQASYHRIPTHRYISVIYYVTSAKICDSWHSHPQQCDISTHTAAAPIVNTPLL